MAGLLTLRVPLATASVGARPGETSVIETSALAATRAKVDPLISAAVEGEGRPDAGVFEPNPAALQMYRRPTDRNEVHTVMALGRTLDTKG
ncbi:hypothetical protein BH11PLA1_BH11PLA1_04460 [soil metagenome]